MAASLFVGPSDQVSWRHVAQWFWQKGAFWGASGPVDPLVEAVLLEVRLPRVILTFLVGSSLTLSGNALQALFRNPLVSPDILGLSSGAAFGAALALSLGTLPLQGSAFFFGLLAVGLSYFMALTRRGVSIVALILAGIIVSGIFTALLTVVQFLTDPFKLRPSFIDHGQPAQRQLGQGPIGAGTHPGRKPLALHPALADECPGLGG